MGLWKRVQRIGKRAAKFDFILSYSGLEVECGASSDKSFGGGKQLCINWTRKNRNKRTKTYEPLCSRKSCHIDFPVPEVVNCKITLYRSNNEHEFDDKYWNVILETVDKTGRIKPIANTKMNMKDYAEDGLIREVSLILKPLKSDYKSVICRFKISCHLIKEGLATDDDMVSLASLMSYGEDSTSPADADVGNLNDFAEFETPDTSFKTPVASFASFTAQMGEFMKMTEEVEEDIWKMKPSIEKTTPNIQEQATTNGHQSGSSPKLYIGTPPVSPATPRTRKQAEIKTRDSSLSPTPPVKPLRKHLAELPDLINDKQTSSNKDLSSLDLLDWAKEITKDYELVKITNYTTSFRNGMAFAAILYHYKTDMIDFRSLHPRNILENNQIVIKLAAKLGIPCIMRAEDMAHMKIPDKLLVKTFLHEIRSYFHGVVSPDAVSLNQNKPAISDIIFGDTPYEAQSKIRQNPSSYPSLALLNRRDDSYRMTVADSVNTTVDDGRITINDTNDDETMDMMENTRRSQDVLESQFEQNLEENLEEPPAITETKSHHLNNPTEPAQSKSKSYPQPTTEQTNHKSPTVLQSPAIDSSSQKSTVLATKNQQSNTQQPHVLINTNQSANSQQPHVLINTNQSANSQQPTVLTTINQSANTQQPTVLTTINKPANTQQPTVLTTINKPANTQHYTVPSTEDHPADNQQSSLLITSNHESTLPANHCNSSANNQMNSLPIRPAQQWSSVNNQNDTRTPESGSRRQSREKAPEKPARKLMTHRELTNPFDSESDEETADSDQTNPFLVSHPSEDRSQSTQDVTYNEHLSTSSSHDSVRTNPFLSDPDPIHNSSDKHYQHVDKIFSTSEYVLMAMADVDRQQRELDEEASKLEVCLRKAMAEGHKAREEELSRCWFSLLNNKNNLIRRMEQLNILEKEENLNTRYELLTRELRRFVSRKDWEKSDEERRREQALLDELVAVVDKRNELIMAIEEQNQCLDADDATALEVEKNLQSSTAAANQQCTIQ